MTEMASVSAGRLAELEERGNIDLIDVRTPAEFRDVHLVRARNIPLDRLDPQEAIKNRIGSADEPIFVICKSGARGAKARQRFIDAGYTNVVNVEGGTEACVSAGLPVQRGESVMSLERQVRIATGLLVLIGAMLSFWNIYFACLSGFVGAGLMFAGLADSCVMGMLIAKMPWNQCKNAGA